MTRTAFKASATFGRILGLCALVSACGGTQAPAESPEATPASVPEAPPPADAPGDGEHTMPDGTKMEGDEHPGDGHSHD